MWSEHKVQLGIQNITSGKAPQRLCKLITRMVPRSMENATTHAKQPATWIFMAVKAGTKHLRELNVLDCIKQLVSSEDPSNTIYGKAHKIHHLPGYRKSLLRRIQD